MFSFHQTARQNATVNFVDESAIRAVQDVKRLPGVLKTEPYRFIEVRLRNGHLTRRTVISGNIENAEMNRVIDLSHQPINPPRDGLLINARLAEVLGIKQGQVVEIDVLEGKRVKRSHLVSSVIESYIGLGAYMELSALNDLVDEGPKVSGVHLLYDTSRKGELFAEIKKTPEVASLTLQTQSLRKFRDTVGENINIITSIYIILSSIIAVGVVYNSARIQFSERARELASLRVLGFTNTEVSRVLLTELLIVILLAQPLGWWFGTVFAQAVTEGFKSDLFTIPFIIETSTYAKASLVVIAASAISILIVRQRLQRLDLVSILKTRD